MRRLGLCVLVSLLTSVPAEAQELYVELQMTMLANRTVEETISADRILDMGLFRDQSAPIDTYTLDLEGDGTNEHIIIGKMNNIPHGLGLDKKIVLVDSKGKRLLSEMSGSNPRVFVDRRHSRALVMVDRPWGPRLVSIKLPPPPP